MPGPICCLLGACCPPPQQIAALKEMYMTGGMDEASAQMAAEIAAPILRAAAKKMGVKFTAAAEE